MHKARPAPRKSAVRKDNDFHRDEKVAPDSGNAGRRVPRGACAGRPRFLASGMGSGKRRLGTVGTHPAGLRVQPPRRPAPLPQAGRRREEGLPHRQGRESQDGRHGRGIMPPADQKGAEGVHQAGIPPDQGRIYARAETHDPHAGQGVAQADRPRNRIYGLRGAQGVPGRIRSGVLAGRIADFRAEPQIAVRQGHRRQDDRADRNLLRSRPAAVCKPG